MNETVAIKKKHIKFTLTFFTFSGKADIKNI
jgi:hypothetical protein